MSDTKNRTTERRSTPERITVERVMTESGVQFGTSGARGLVSALTDRVAAVYALGFVSFLERTGRIERGSRVALAGDLRPSSPRILRALVTALSSQGWQPDFLGFVPSPALVLYGMKERIPTIMITGSHIPADRNGMKMTTPDGEITKSDEEQIRAQAVELDLDLNESGQLVAPLPLPQVNDEGARLYVERSVSAFPVNCLSGLRLGWYGHSAVGRELLSEIVAQLGAEVVPLGYSEEFVPVDTEAIRPEDEELARKWAEEHRVDAILSTDGDSDRPLLSDENGEWFRGDVLGIHTARYLGADGVALPVSCNEALERSGSVARAVRTRIGSPYVIAGMEQLVREGAVRVVGYEANGGFLHHSPLPVPGGGTLVPLPSRDPTIVHLATLLAARSAGVPLSRLNESLPPCVTASGRDTAFSVSRSRALLDKLRSFSHEELTDWWGLGPLERVDETDGLRYYFSSGELVHLRPSGNAPELRCYAEAGSKERADELVLWGLDHARALG